MSRTLDIYSLGGCGGFGMNATLLASGGRGLLIDFGIGFPRTVLPGVSLTVPDAGPLSELVPDLAAVILTHAHDDHCAGLPYLPERWRRAPVHGPGLALATAADRLDDAQVPRPRMHPAAPGSTAELGPFRVTFIPIPHSVPDAALLAIETPAGLLVHSSDFKLDLTPVRGPAPDFDRLRALGSRGVKLLFLDSTGARRPGRTGSESSVVEPLARAIADTAGQVVVSTFASHLTRIQTALAGAQRTGRRAALLGQRMTRTVRHGIDLRLFDAPAGLLVSPEDLAELRPDQRLWLAGGCQGEPQSSLCRLSYDNDTRAEVGRGDTVIVSGSIVPGNEMPVARMLDRLLRLGASVRHAQDEPDLHVSGHGSRDELVELLALLRPEIVVPVHGDRMHLEAAARLAEQAEPPPRQVLIIEKGDRLELTTIGAVVAERMELYTNYLDDSGAVLTPGVLRERQQIASTGLAVVQARRPVRGEMSDDALRIEGIGIPGWDAVLPDARRAALDVIRSSPAYTPVSDLELELARRVGNLLRRGSRYRPRVVVLLE